MPSQAAQVERFIQQHNGLAERTLAGTAPRSAATLRRPLAEVAPPPAGG